MRAWASRHPGCAGRARRAKQPGGTCVCSSSRDCSAPGAHETLAAAHHGRGVSLRNRSHRIWGSSNKRGAHLQGLQDLQRLFGRRPRVGLRASPAQAPSASGRLAHRTDTAMHSWCSWESVVLPEGGQRCAPGPPGIPGVPGTPSSPGGPYIPGGPAHAAVERSGRQQTLSAVWVHTRMSGSKLVTTCCATAPLTRSTRVGWGAHLQAL